MNLFAGLFQMGWMEYTNFAVILALTSYRSKTKRKQSETKSGSVDKIHPEN